MPVRREGRFSQRAILIYCIAIVAPACVVLWLGIQSFQRQHEALASLASERLATEEEKALDAASREALDRGQGPVARFFFRIEHGVVTKPALEAAPRDPAREGFADAERKEFAANQTEAALEAYRELANAHRHEALALSGVARCLGKLGRAEEARAVWRKLAGDFPDDRDLSHRPFGIVAAMEAGDTQGLYDRIASGRWELSADQAEFFLNELDPKRTTPYLDQFRFARELGEQFRPSGAGKPGEVESFRFDSYRVFYRDDGSGAVSGFAVNQDWVEHTLRPQLERALGFADFGKRDLRMYGAAMAAVFLILSAGVALLWRDVSREARTNRIRADLVSSVSHELKTPITLIRLYGDTLLDREGLSAGERTEFYRIIVRESERLSRLVNQILTFSRIERGAQSYNFEEGDLREAIGGIVDDYREYLDRAGFTVERRLEASAPVRFDATALSQAVTNLLDNAVKYSGASREIGVRLAAADGQVTFEVEDHGVGVPAAEQAKIFERFYRASNVNGNGKAGYGLGLFLVRHIMEAHGGRAEVESAPGQGSRFRLVFPAVSQS